MDYNTQREKLILPEYGRLVQDMIEKVKKIPDRAKRTEQMQATIQVMAILNPSLREQPDYKQKLWDHAHISAGFDLDVDCPYPVPTKEEVNARPEPLPLQTEPLKAAHYGRNIQNMIDVIAAKEDGELKDAMIKAMASYMRQQYLIWNKDSVTEEIIFKDILELSQGRLQVPEHIHLDALSSHETFNRPGLMGDNQRGGFNGNKKNKKNRRWKK